MRVFLEGLRTGAWLTRARMWRIGLALLAASALGLGFLAASADGLNDFQGRPLGTDFSSFYSAGTLVLDGRPAAPYDLLAHHAREQAIFGAATPYYAFLYPPFFLLVAAALALLPYLLALSVWLAATLALYLLAIRTIVGRAPPGTESGGDRLWFLLALAFPAVFVNLGHGQNAFLTASLLAIALCQLERRPALAGILFGLMAYKPQLGLMIPLALAAGGNWRSFAAAVLTVAALALATLAAFGPEVWKAFFDSTSFTRAVMIELGELGWHKMQGVFAWARMWGAGIPLAYAVQGSVTLIVGGTLVWLWRSSARFALKATALALGTILATPFSLDYDMMVLSVAIAFLAVNGQTHGFAPYEKTAIACLWLAPLIARSFAEWTMIPLGVVAMLTVFALVMRRAAADLSTERSGWISAQLPIK